MDKWGTSNNFNKNARPKSNENKYHPIMEGVGNSDFPMTAQGYSVYLETHSKRLKQISEENTGTIH